MSVHKVIEILSYSKESWEDAARQAIIDASKTIDNIESIYIVDHSAKVENNEVVQFRINAKITFKISE